MDLKSAMEKATEIWRANPQKKPSLRKWEYQGKIAFYHYWSLVVVPYALVGYSECQRSACVTSAEQSAVYLQSAKTSHIVTVFHSVKPARLGGFWNFHKWGQINNYGESPIMLPQNAGICYVKTGSMEGELRFNGAPVTQNLLRKIVGNIGQV